MKTSGIYCIENLISNKKYIGSSIDCERRWYIHKWNLRKKSHANQHLQSAWDFYGEQSFVFLIVEVTQEENLSIREKFYIDEYKVLDREFGYNIAEDTLAPMRGRKHSVKSLQKMSDSKIGEKNTFYGKRHSSETKEKISSHKKGKFLTPEHREKVIKSLKKGEENINAKLTLEKVRAIRKKHKDGVTTQQLSIEYGVARCTINRIIKNLAWKEEENSENSK